MIHGKAYEASARILLVLLLLATAPVAARSEPEGFLVPSGGAEPLATEDEVSWVRMEPDPITGRDLLLIRLEAEAAERMREYTAAHVGRFLEVRADGKVLSKMRIQESVAGTIALFGLQEAETDLILSRHPNLLVPETAGIAALYVPAAGLPIFKPVSEKPGRYRAAARPGTEIFLSLEAVIEAFEEPKKETDGNRLLRTGTGTYVFSSVLRVSEGGPVRVFSVRGSSASLRVGLDLVLPESEATPEAAAEIETILENVVRGLKPAPER